MSVATLSEAISRLSSLRQRILTACVLAPLFVLVFYFGGQLFILLLTLVMLRGFYEWIRLSYHTTVRVWPKLLENIGYATLLLAIAMADFVTYELAYLMLVVGIFATWIISHLYLERGPKHAAFLIGFGVLYLGIATIALIWLRQHGKQVAPDRDWILLMMLILHVWATDTFAYIAGRLIGGPKLAPKISPNKTWAGLIGGSIAAGLVLGALAQWVNMPYAVWFYGLGLILGGVAQMGDLLESYLKRQAGFKDSGSLLPGHGGVLDRIDGLIMAAPVFMIITWALI